MNGSSKRRWRAKKPRPVIDALTGLAVYLIVGGVLAGGIYSLALIWPGRTETVEATVRSTHISYQESGGTYATYHKEPVLVVVVEEYPFGFMYPIGELSWFFSRELYKTAFEPGEKITVLVQRGEFREIVDHHERRRKASPAERNKLEFRFPKYGPFINYQLAEALEFRKGGKLQFVWIPAVIWYGTIGTALTALGSFLMVMFFLGWRERRLGRKTKLGVAPGILPPRANAEPPGGPDSRDAMR